MASWEEDDDRITDLIVALTEGDGHVNSDGLIYTVEVPLVTPPDIEVVALQESPTSIVVGAAGDANQDQSEDDEEACVGGVGSPGGVLRLLAAEVQAAAARATEQEQRSVHGDREEHRLRESPCKTSAGSAAEAMDPPLLSPVCPSSAGSPALSSSTISAVSSDDEEGSRLEDISHTIQRMHCQQEKEVLALRQKHGNEAAPVEADLFAAFFDKIKSVRTFSKPLGQVKNLTYVFLADERQKSVYKEVVLLERERWAPINVAADCLPTGC
jgi:hypothetical protein